MSHHLQIAVINGTSFNGAGSDSSAVQHGAGPPGHGLLLRRLRTRPGDQGLAAAGAAHTEEVASESPART